MSHETQQPQEKSYVRPNDRWQCSIDEGQPCGGGGNHLPREGSCTPRPSLRMQRGIFTIACTALICGLLIACWNSPKRNEFLAPGPLTDSHAQILIGEGTDRCASCHGAGNESLSGWIQDAIKSGRHIPVSQSQLCMDCHDKSLAAEFALHAHNLAPTSLASITTNTTKTHDSFSIQDPRDAYGRLACATCHQEHHGADFNLAALSDKQCQTCHVNHFHSFEKDHPEFNNWPFNMRTGIAFDHASHGIKYFPEKGEAFDCRSCHIDDKDGIVKLVNPFEMTCAKCHDKDISGDQSQDWTLFQVPLMDIESLEQEGLSIGHWPENCQGDFDGKLPAAMKLLLMSDPVAASILNNRDATFEFADLDPGNVNDLQDAASLAWSIKNLLYGLAINGNQEIRERLQKSLNTQLDTSELKGLTYGLHDAVFAQAQQRWMPRLLTEITARNKELNGNHRIEPNRIFAKPIVQEDDTLAENPLKELYADKNMVNSEPEKDNTSSNKSDGSTATQPTAENRVEIPAVPEGTGSVDDRLAVEVDQLSTKPTEDFALPDKKEGKFPFEGQGDELAINPLAGFESGIATDIPKAPPANPPANSINEANNATAGNEPNAPDDSTSNPTLIESTTPDSNEPDSNYEITDQQLRDALVKLAGQGADGWKRDDSAFRISYRVKEHRDPIMKSWTDLAMDHAPHNAIQNSTVFDVLNTSKITGQCRQCHTADIQDDASVRMNWRPRYRDVSVRGFTRFSHRPHNIQTSLLDCNSCHQLEKSQSNSGQFASLDGTNFQSNFAAISKNGCASCHREGGAPSGCVDCHNYHIGSKVSAQK